jgi:RHS repeat-associated protein
MQKEARNSQNQIIGQYFFDGNGKRVKKISNTETTIFVYDAGGQLIAEYSNQTSQTPQVSYLTSDTLGSPRVLTNASGAVTSRHDYMAYGEEISRPNYGSDTVRQKYTGYEKDTETDLDFAQARMYASKLGRFSTTDPLMASASAINPQTFNRYIYVLNSPYKLLDPTGLAPEGKAGIADRPDFGNWGSAEEEAQYDKNLAITREEMAKAKESQEAAQNGANEALHESLHEAATEEVQEDTVNSPETSSTHQNIEGPFIVPENIIERYENSPDLTQPQCGNGSCAVLPQVLLKNKLPTVWNWFQGIAVDGNEDKIAKGTVIATFNLDGRYGPPGTREHNRPKNNHAAVYLYTTVYNEPGHKFHGLRGIVVIDQWERREHNGKKVSGLRFIPYLTGAMTTPSNDARAFSVVMVKRRSK